MSCSLSTSRQPSPPSREMGLRKGLLRREPMARTPRQVQSRRISTLSSSYLAQGPRKWPDNHGAPECTLPFVLSVAVPRSLAGHSAVEVRASGERGIFPKRPAFCLCETNENLGSEILPGAVGNSNILTLDKGTSKLPQSPSAQTTLIQIERYTQEAPQSQLSIRQRRGDLVSSGAPSSSCCSARRI